MRCAATEAAGKAVLELFAEAVHYRRLDPEGRRERGEVRTREIDSERRVACVELVEAQHPVTTVVDEHDRDRQLLLRDRRELAAGERNPPSPLTQTVGPVAASAVPSEAGKAKPSVPQPTG